MQFSERGEHFVKNFESLRLYKYRDQAGLWTNGFGHLLAEHEIESLGVITLEKAEELFDQDAAEVFSLMRRVIKVPLRQGQIDAIASLIFNIGNGAFAGSTLLKRLNAGQLGLAAAQFNAWIMVADPVTKKKHPSDGLIRRRADERLMFEGKAFAVPKPVLPAVQPKPLPPPLPVSVAPPAPAKPVPKVSPPQNRQPSKKALPQKPKG